MLNEAETSVHILLADDDEEDCLLTEKALEKTGQDIKLSIVHDGEELLEYLRRQGEYANQEDLPRPHLILLDLNMPRKDGREALDEIKKDSGLCEIPVVVLTTSQANEDVQRLYELGANSFVTKPITFPDMVHAMTVLSSYWMGIVRLPE